MKPKIWRNNVFGDYPWVVRVVVRKFPNAPPNLQSHIVRYMFAETWEKAIVLVTHGYQEGYILR